MQTSIRVFSSTLDFIAEIDDYSSLTFQRKLYGAGIFALRIAADSKYADELLTKNRIITLGNDERRAGIIKSIQYIQSDDNEIYIIQGYELKGILKQRITIPTAGSSHVAFSNKTGEYILKGLVTQNQNTAGREFTLLEVATNLDRGTNATTKSRYKELHSEISRIGKTTMLGNEIYIDFATKKFIFDIIPITDKTSGTANPVIFSTKYDNIKRQQYFESDMNSYNFASVGGQGSGSARTIIEAGDTTTNFELSEMFIDARDIDTTNELEARGEEKLTATQPEIAFDCEVLDNKPFLYRTDWDIGTKVTIISERLGLSFDKAIEEVTEYYDDGFRIGVVFGTPQKTLRDNIYIASDYGID